MTLNTTLGLTTLLVLIMLIVWSSRRRKKLQEEYEQQFIAQILGICRKEKVLNEEQAEDVLHIWWSVREFIAGHFVKCACGAIEVHCEADEQIIDNVKHTTKFCDMVEKP